MADDLTFDPERPTDVTDERIDAMTDTELLDWLDFHGFRTGLGMRCLKAYASQEVTDLRSAIRATAKSARPTPSHE